MELKESLLAKKRPKNDRKTTEKRPKNDRKTTLSLCYYLNSSSPLSVINHCLPLSDFLKSP